MGFQCMNNLPMNLPMNLYIYLHEYDKNQKTTSLNAGKYTRSHGSYGEGVIFLCPRDPGFNFLELDA